MIIGIPKEQKNGEFRVGLTPHSVAELCKAGHQLLVEQGAASAIGFSDDDYQVAGATVLSRADDIFADAELIVKVKEPNIDECHRLKPNQRLFTYLHLAASAQTAHLLCQSGITAFAYETLADVNGNLPLLIPMSEIAGSVAVQAGVQWLSCQYGGRGTLLCGCAGVPPGKVVIIGAGSVGCQAAALALGLGADVTLLDISPEPLRRALHRFGSRLKTAIATQTQLTHLLPQTDLLIGAVLVPGASAPKVVSEALVATMPTGSVIVDVAIDQGGCIATSQVTSHQTPTYQQHGVIHYCVPNMPSTVARSATEALNAATLPYIKRLASQSLEELLASNDFASALNVHRGKICHLGVAHSLNLPYYAPSSIL